MEKGRHLTTELQPLGVYLSRSSHASRMMYECLSMPCYGQYRKMCLSSPIRGILMCVYNCGQHVFTDKDASAKLNRPQEGQVGQSQRTDVAGSKAWCILWSNLGNYAQPLWATSSTPPSS